MSSRRNGITNRSEKKHKNSFTEANNVRQIMNILEKNSSQAFSLKQIGRKLGVKGKKNQQHLLNNLLELENRGKISQIEPTVFQLIRKNQTVLTGKVDFVNPRFAFII